MQLEGVRRAKGQKIEDIVQMERARNGEQIQLIAWGI